MPFMGKWLFLIGSSFQGDGSFVNGIIMGLAPPRGLGRTDFELEVGDEKDLQNKYLLKV